jgi:hypothetical protein
MRKIIVLLVLFLNLLVTLHAQKGERSLAAGLLLAFPETYSRYRDFSNWKTSIGIEGIGQYNLSEKSALLLQLQVIRFAGRRYNGFTEFSMHELSTALKGGYRYQFDPSGFFINALVGYELNSGYTPVAVGAGKRFLLKNSRFLDAGIEYAGGYISSYRLKAVFSLLRRMGDN